MKNFLNIIYIILLYIFTFYLIFIINIIYTMWADFSTQLTQPYFVLIVYCIFLLWIYLIYILIHGVYKKTLSKKYLYGYLLFFPIFLLFYFTYYIQYDEILHISESEFETKLQNIDVKDEENGLMQLSKLYSKNENFYSTISNLNSQINNNYNCLVKNKGKNCEQVNIRNTLEIYNSYSEIVNEVNDIFLNISNLKYFKEKINGEFTSFQGVSTISRLSLFSVIDNIEKGNEEKAKEILLTYKNLGDKILQGDTGLIGMIVGITFEGNVIDNINYIINNYNIKKENLEEFKNELNYNYDSHQILLNAIKIEYWSNKYSLTEGENNGYIRSSMLFNKEEFFNETRNAWLRLLNGEAPSNNDNYFKRNYLYRFLSGTSNLNGVDYKKDIENLDDRREKLLEKIDQKIRNYN